ncbi:MAG: SUMF1/EgtB/PvdO family nonheme iron enzyme [Pseudomonadota bacterium]
MRLNSTVARLLVLGLLHATALPGAIAHTPESKNNDAAEVMPDGNLRDPAPSPEVIKEFLANTQKNLVFLRGGTFEMGDWGAQVNKGGLPFDGTLDSKPLHKVTLDSFFIGKFPVTYGEFDLFSASMRLPRINQSNADRTHRKPDNPAGVTWQGATDYCAWLAKQTGQSFSLPTEAQWEYAARSEGKRLVYPTNNGQSEPGKNLPSLGQMEVAGGYVSVSSFPPNPAGIYYMSAGVHEWVQDWYDKDYYSNSSKKNPTGPATGTRHVARGFAGSDSSAMTFKRWAPRENPPTGTWTSYPADKKEPTKEIPYTTYSNYAGNAFRCVRLASSTDSKALRTP